MAEEGATLCVACAKGKYAPQSRLATCRSCEAGEFAAGNGSLVCQVCPVGADSLAGAAECALAAVGWFLDPTTAEKRPCPDSATCSGGKDAPRPKKVSHAREKGNTKN